MIKFFRKIRKKLLTAGKTGTYLKYALGEIVLVVLGILIALQINNWNENGKLRNQELLLLKNLKLEMEENLVLINNYLETNEKRVENANLLLSYTSPVYIGKKEDSLNNKFSEIFYVDDFKPEIMVLNAAKNSNSITLIKNQQIRTNLSRWEQSLTRLLDYISFGNEHFNNSLIPIVSDYYAFRNIPQDAGNRNIQDSSEHINEIEKMFRSRDFENSLFRMKNFNLNRIRGAKELKDYTLELIQLLNKELKT